MRRLVPLGIVLLAAVAAVPALAPMHVSAMGAPTENYTVPDPLNDPSNREVKFQSGFELRGPSTQAASDTPSFTTSFMGPSNVDRRAVVGKGEWFLDVDINMPGWLYLYENYPSTTGPAGEWLAYKWQLKQGGSYRLGPFKASEAEPHGTHVYRIWFYGNGLQAASNSNNSVVYWTYYPPVAIDSFSAVPASVRPGDNVTLSWQVQGAKSAEIAGEGQVTAQAGEKIVTPDKTKVYVLTATDPEGKQVQRSVTVNVTPSAPASPQAPSASTPPEAPKPANLFDSLFTLTALITVLSVAVLLVLGILLYRVYVKRWASPATILLPSPAKPEETPADMAPPRHEPVAGALARLELPSGLEIPLSGNSTPVGRADLARALSLDELGLVSHRQFTIVYENERYFIEDGGGANGAKLNGDDLKDKGRPELKDGDVIEAAGIIKLKFARPD